MTKIGRNDPCPCGSGKKYKKCCLPLEDARELGMLKSQRMDNDEEDVEYWSKEEVEEWSTEEIFEELASLGFEVDEDGFRAQVRENRSAAALSDAWFSKFDVVAQETNEEFLWFACMVLWDRLAPDVPYAEEFDDLVEAGYLALDDNRPRSACDQWLSAWEMLKVLAPGINSFEALDEALELDINFDVWTSDLATELGRLSQGEPSYEEKRVLFEKELAEWLA